MRKSIIIFCLLVVCCFAKAQNIVQAEYFFDNNDLGFGSCTAISLIPSVDSTWQFSPALSVVGLPVGNHKLYIRTKDSNNHWSQTIRRNLNVLNTFTKDSVIAAEWFLDNGDLGFGLCASYSITNPDSAITETFTVPTSALTGLSYGHHKVYSRVRDTNQKWSHTIRRNFDLLKSVGNKDVVDVEYFFTDDLGFSSCYNLPLTPSTDSTWIFNIPYNQIPVFNVDTTIFFRVRDSLNGEWAHTVKKRQIFYPSSVGIDETISGNGYSIFPNPASDNLNISFSNISEPVQFNLLNTLGEVVQQEILTEESTTVKLNQVTGIYFVKLSSGKKTVTRKIIIQNK